MKILAINDVLVPIGASMRNASIAFDQMTASAVAVITDRGVGYAFDSIGRYGKSGLLRERFIPRHVDGPGGLPLDQDPRRHRRFPMMPRFDLPMNSRMWATSSDRGISRRTRSSAWDTFRFDS